MGPERMWDVKLARQEPRSFSLQGDIDIAIFAARELYRSYSELPVRIICDLALRAQVRSGVATHAPDAPKASRAGSIRADRRQVARNSD
jgi:hypothetical protein